VCSLKLPGCARCGWIATDKTACNLADEWRDPAATCDTLALIQYTSGSTAIPRGVMVSHGNLLENSAHIDQALRFRRTTYRSRGCRFSMTWDSPMELSNLCIEGVECVLMPPQSFFQRPVRWLQAVSKYKATISGGPNFAYEMCARKITPEQRSGLDLSSWKLAYNGAEPVRADTLKRFCCGL